MAVAKLPESGSWSNAFDSFVTRDHGPCRSPAPLPRKICIRDIYVEHQNGVIVSVDLGRSFEARSSDNLISATRRQLKCCSPLDVGEILPIVHLRLVRDHYASGFDQLSRPARILRPSAGTNGTNERKNRKQILVRRMANSFCRENAAWFLAFPLVESSLDLGLF